MAWEGEGRGGEGEGRGKGRKGRGEERVGRGRGGVERGWGVGGEGRGEGAVTVSCVFFLMYFIQHTSFKLYGYIGDRCKGQKSAPLLQQTITSTSITIITEGQRATLLQQ